MKQKRWPTKAVFMFTMECIGIAAVVYWLWNAHQDMAQGEWFSTAIKVPIALAIFMLIFVVETKEYRYRKQNKHDDDA